MQGLSRPGAETNRAWAGGDDQSLTDRAARYRPTHPAARSRRTQAPFAPTGRAPFARLIVIGGWLIRRAAERFPCC